MFAGPLMAVIDAQSAAALTTMDFIRNVGFDENGDARNVSFIYDRLNSTSGAIESKTLTVPLLTIIPIPYVRVRAALRSFLEKLPAGAVT